MSLLDSGAIGRYHADMGGATGESAAKEAALVQMKAMEDARKAAEAGYASAEGFYQPYIQPGMDAYNRMVSGSTAEGLGANLESLQASPAIMALMNARSKRVQNQLGSTGLSRSGYGARELGRVDEETLMGIEQMLNGRQGGIANMGYSAGQNLSGLGVDKTKTIMDMILGLGKAQASGILGAAEAQVAGSQNRYTAIHNVGSGMMNMFGGMGGGGGGGSAPQGGTTSGINQQQGGIDYNFNQPYQPSYGYDYNKDMRLKW